MELYKIVYPLFIIVNSDTDRDNFMRFYDKVISESDGFIGFRDVSDVGGHNCITLLYNSIKNIYKVATQLERLGFSGDRMLIARDDYSQQLKHPLPLYKDNLCEIKNDIISIGIETFKKICLTTEEQIDNDKLAMSDLTDYTKLPLHSYTLALKGVETLLSYTYDSEKNILKVERFSDKKHYLISKIKIHLDMLNGQHEVEVVYDMEEETEHYPHQHCMYFFALNYFIRNLPTTYHKTTKKETKLIESGKGMNKKYKHSVVLKTTYEFNDKVCTKEHIRHLFKCLCWGVRGHTRHLANGKEIFIQAYHKGKDRDNFEKYIGKEYKI